MSSITPVILCGGSGTRLWPLSRKSFPKQFVPLVGDKSLLQLTLERVASLGSKVVTVAADDHRFLVADSLRLAKVQGTIVLEPAARNTAAAMALAALNASPEEFLLFCPADHHIPDAAAFVRTMREGLSAADSGAIVTFGVVPSFPSTAYGYIRQGAPRPDGSLQVAQFIEKPDAARAQELLLKGDALWNAGIFLAQARFLVEALEEHAPDILQSCVRPAPPSRPAGPRASTTRSWSSTATSPCSPSAASGATSAAGTRWRTWRRPMRRTTVSRDRAGRTTRATPSSMRRTAPSWHSARRTC
jgi:mannose-1-phosphate guanylyltransferase/mannose-6-phosphate isomerase